MRRRLFSMALCLTLFLTGCSSGGVSENTTEAITTEPEAVTTEAVTTTATTEEEHSEEVTTTETEETEMEIILTVNVTELTVAWEDNESVVEIRSYLETGSITATLNRYGGFEQVGSLPQAFTRSDVQMTTNPGDIVLYSGNQIVIFFGNNSWAYTKLGHIEGLSDEELRDLLDTDSVEITLELK
ncbi:MAG: hypothetical protein LUH18_03880 [Oscillospiraceae bacterium]|nr:hypothetical protein [Oscillospiraceae bacterium]